MSELDTVRTLLVDASNAVNDLLGASDSADEDRRLKALDKAIDGALAALDDCAADHDQIAYDRHVDQCIDEARGK